MHQRTRINWIAAIVAAVVAAPLWAEETEYDVVVYGGTSAGVTAAVQARRMGRTAVIVGPDKHLGGLSSGGLGYTDTGNKGVIGGLAREFYHRVWQHYQEPAAWRWQKREEFGNKGQGTPAIDGAQRTMWIFEPHVAEAACEAMVREAKVPVHRDEWLDRQKGVEINDGRIVAITMLSGKTYRGKMFIDATYEGDLMAAAGVKYHVGRESNTTYGERWNGVQKDARHHGHFFNKPIDPYVVPGDPKSGLLPRISAEPPGEDGEGDDKLQAYCFRMCLTKVPANRVPFAKPEGYDPKEYELLRRVLAAGWRETFNKFDAVPNGKTDTNNHGPFSTDNIGFNHDYPEANYERRREIIREHEQYQQGLMYYLANDPGVPEDVRSAMAGWGLAKDEFTDNGNWPHQIYVREARRMIGPYVMIEQDTLSTRDTPESVGMGSYSLDSHNVQRYVTSDGHVQNEGDIGVRAPRPYKIAYGSLTPKRDECTNLLVPICLSSSHIAYGSIRMEPVFMILGQSAATAAVMAIDGKLDVQDVAYAKLRERLLADGQILEYDGPSKGGVDVRKLEGIVLDDTQAKLTGKWGSSGALGPYVGSGYLHDGNQQKGKLSARFETELKPGRYEVRICYSPSDNRAAKVPIAIMHAKGTATRTIDQRKPHKAGEAFVSLGEYEFGPSGSVEISNAGTQGHVIVDAVQFIRTQ